MAKDTSLTVSLFGKDVSFSSSMDKAGKSAKTASDVMNDAAKKASAVLVGLGGAAIMAGKAAAEDEQSSALLANTLKNVTGATTAQIKATEDYISKQTLSSGIADDKLRPAFARLITSTKNVTEAQKLTNLAMEIATAKHLDLETVANALGKAHDGNIGALKKLGISLDATTVKNKDFEGAVKELGNTFKGSLETNANTAAGKFQIFQNSMNEAKESLGAGLLPVMKDFADIIQKIAPFLTQHADIIGKVALGIGALAAAVVSVNMAIKVYEAYTKAAAAAQVIFNAVMSMNPIGLTVIALAALTAGLILAYKNSETFRDAVNSSFNAIKVVAETVAKFVGTVFSTAFGIIKAEMNLIIRLVNMAITTLNKINFKVPDWVPGIGGKGFDVNLPTIPMLANGGIVSGPTFAMIGEAGPEAVVPLGRGMGMGTNVTVYVSGSVITEKDLAVKVRNEIAQLMRRKGADVALLGL